MRIKSLEEYEVIRRCVELLDHFLKMGLISIQEWCDEVKELGHHDVFESYDHISRMINNRLSLL